VPFRLDSSDDEFQDWLAQTPSEDALRDAYVFLETKRAQLFTPGHIDSFRRDRYEIDSQCVLRLVRIKWALANHWASTGQFSRLSSEPQPA
jgi:hypothetical protein